MIFTILNADGKKESQVEADSVQQACRTWGQKCWPSAVVEDAVLKAKLIDLDGSARAAHLDPYLVCPEGRETETIRRNEKLLETDVHFAPDPSQIQPRLVDTGGRG
ncbi:unnamed protein product [Phaeothamnion confervicola]